ncbi:MAG: SDR family oxidoreductase [Gammaproteobacteria bacterium]|nr:SDR family oxidoreductase [Gammaproteobacteria bacterium]MCP4089520.1 SDR family oxidoreductase [Gammaproteobacteria bacterium]MCP4832923.1 SDR family oxidoreductase [Gammaproteobacteria bacterium]MCP4930048.1 SDR family oxidoreductase [Gammaproteobacteria bacterium]
MKKIYLALLICFFTSISVHAQEESTKPESITTIGNPANFSASKPTVLITGANRGIGLEFVKQIADRDWNIIATARKPENATDLQEIAKKHDQLVIERLDVTDFERMQELQAKYAEQAIDVLLSNAGITPKYKSAFKRVAGVDWDMMRKSLDVNAIAPLQLAKTFIDNVAASEQKKIVVISSKAGSFELSPKMPMMYSYRGSKAALNMYMYTLSFETPKKGVILTLLSPGQVNTVPGMKIPNAIETDESVSKMLAVIDSLTPEQNGKFLDFEDGSELGW